MKADVSRNTFVREKHFSGVVMQQGRVSVDADFNEQQAITRYREETEARDVIGRCGSPLDPPDYTDGSGFEIEVSPATPNTFTIGAGRYYVDGLLCENESTVGFLDQVTAPLEYPAAQAVLDTLGDAAVGLVYIDVWRRLITRLEDASIHEVALGEADTTTRAKTSWQVKVLPLPSVDVGANQTQIDNLIDLIDAAGGDADPAAALAEVRSLLGPAVSCGADYREWDALTQPNLGTLSATTGLPAPTPDPCLPPPTAGYRRLENQLYRVEIHEGNVAGGNVTFKWSRENASVATRILDYDGTDPTWITVDSLGHDAVTLGFSKGDWVEIVNDHSELSTDGTQLGYLATIVDLDEGTSSIQLSRVPDPPGSPDPASLRDRSTNPRLRRWDQVQLAAIPASVSPPSPAVDAVTPTDDGVAVTSDPIPLEDGIAVTFLNDGVYRPGDYWQIPARTVLGDIEWPRDAADNPLALKPFGVKHHYCRLALIARDSSRERIVVLSDCRNLFPPLTALQSFFYLGGDGQEVFPSTEVLTPLPEPIQVGVARGKAPVAGAWVSFRIQAGAGQVNGSPTDVEVQTDANGVAQCNWSVASDPSTPTQQVVATLLDGPGGTAVHLPITFSAELNLAQDVFYSPACQQLQDANVRDVATALDTLCNLVGQTAAPAIHVVKVMHGHGQPLVNDMDIAAGDLAPIIVELDKPVDPASIPGKSTVISGSPNSFPACYVTLYLPWPEQSGDAAIWGSGLLGFHPVELAAVVKVQGRTIIWEPAGETGKFVQGVLFKMLGKDTARVLGRYTLKGSFVHTPGDRERWVYLDGEPLGPYPFVGGNPRSGDGQPGGDFELWFWLTQNKTQKLPVPDLAPVPGPLVNPAG